MSTLPGLSKGKVVDGQLVLINPDNGKEEIYDVTEVPDSDMSLVLAARGLILHDLSLGTVLTDLQRAGDLMYVAFVGVKGTDLASRVSNRQIELAELCADCVKAMDALREGSRAILANINEALEFLLEAEEPRALDIFADCSQYAKNMATKCGELAGRFQTIMASTKTDIAATEDAVTMQTKKLQEFKGKKNRSEVVASRHARRPNPVTEHFVGRNVQSCRLTWTQP
jgi:hypothetical protein